MSQRHLLIRNWNFAGVFESYQKKKTYSSCITIWLKERICSSVMMNKGSIIDQGKPAELIKNMKKKYGRSFKTTREKYEFK